MGERGRWGLDSSVALGAGVVHYPPRVIGPTVVVWNTGFAVRFLEFMSQPAGRAIRVGAGVALLAVGQFVLDGGVGAAVSVAALLPLLTGVLNLCPISPMVGLPVKGCAAPARRRITR